MQHTPYWNINGGVWIDLLALIAVIIFGYGVRRHWLKIKNGEERFRISKENLTAILKAADLKRFFIGGILGSRVYRDTVTGVFHGMIFWGMLSLFIGTTLVILNVLFGLPVMSGTFYKWYMAFFLDFAGLIVMVGLLYLMYRRLMQYNRLYKPKPREKFMAAELFLLSIVLTGFILEGIRINLTGAVEPAFVGTFFSHMLPSGENAVLWHRGLWWFHGFLAIAFIAYIPYSPLMHIFLVPTNAALADTYMGAETKALDFEAMEEAEDEADLPPLGAGAIDDFDDVRRLDFATCLWCGRCQEVCPATLTDKKLTPKGVMITLADWLEKNKSADEGLIEAVGQDEIFECRTCGACSQACPAFVNPLKSIWQMRQNLVMERGELPEIMGQACKDMEAYMHPFSTSTSPDDWRRDLEVPIYVAGDTQYLLWIGCAVAYDDRAQAVGRAMVNILNQTDISYGIIEEARCTGDPAKQMGDDYLFSMMANTNIELFNEMGVKNIITMCPHCYNSFKQYYPPLGATFHPIPHSVLLRDLIHQGKIRLNFTGEKVTYHDPCYLGRHNGIFKEPRDVIKFFGKIVEMDRKCENSFCCGAGGGNYWHEEEGSRINQARAKEALETGAEKMMSSCPFCLSMLTDGIKAFRDDKFAFDIAELVEQHMRTS